MRFVDVAINLPVKNLFKQYTYLLPERFSSVTPGWRVIVPFGKQQTEGFVVSENKSVALNDASKYKEVLATIGDEAWFNDDMMRTAEWIAEYYLCSVAEAMRLFIPGKGSIRRKAVYDESGRLQSYIIENKLKARFENVYVITDEGYEFLNIGNTRAKKQILALEILQNHCEGMSGAELNALGISADVVRSLLSKNLCKREARRIFRNSYGAFAETKETFKLNDEQAEAFVKIKSSLEVGKYETFLLKGVTGSGKTEIYLRSAAEALASGKQVLILVPEIALTAQMIKRFQAWFGDEVVVVHSKLNAAERADAFYKVRFGEANILIGVRSAIFAPFKNLGLIVIDEEHDASYKQEERPCYHAKDVALFRAKECNAMVVLGSATPSIESYHQAQSGIYKLLTLNKRATGGTLPEVAIVDMRKELEERNFSVLSRKLQQELVRTVALGEQAIVLLNRRGYSTFVMCRDCGETISCSHCSVAMVYHSDGENMRCHYCGQTAQTAQVCPKCGSKRIKFFGSGTQKAEQTIAELPDVRVLRMDQDSTMRKFAHEDILSDFTMKKYNVLIGTQMVAKGHDIPNVTLVGVLAADASLNMPDFRAGERTFALLTQVAGRAGRGAKAGRVVLQSYDPDNKILKMAAEQNYERFAESELEFRQELFYPPFSQLIKITVVDKDEAQAILIAERVKEFLEALKIDDTYVMGPFAGIVAKVRDLYRVNVILKTVHVEEIKKALWKSEFMGLRNVYFDVDPYNVL